MVGFHMKLHELQYAEGSKTSRKRVGRGPGSGVGKTCGKGHKGQRSRSGSGIHPWSEGGQMPLQRRLPKRGFTSIFKKQYELINLDRLEERFEDGTDITIDLLQEVNLVKKIHDGVKILGRGELTKKFHVHAHFCSKAAEEKIKAVGGEITIEPLKG
jgi:large subunit ribosomal protein L15